MVLLLVTVNCFSQTPYWQWARTAQNDSVSAYSEGHDMATDNDGNIFISGNYSGALHFGSILLTPNSGGYIAKYSKTGDVIWAKDIKSGIYSVVIQSIATDGSGNIYLVGDFSGNTLSIGSFTYTTSVGGGSFFLIKLDASGNVVWVKSKTNSFSAGINDVATDKSGNVYITGSLDSSVLFGSDNLTHTGMFDIFLAKYSSSGNELWARNSFTSQSNAWDESNSVATDDLGNVYITGSFSSSTLTLGNINITGLSPSDVFLAKYSSAGNILWVKGSQGGLSGVAVSEVVTTNSFGKVFITGYFHSIPTSFGAFTLTPTGMSNVFIVEYDESGNEIWAKQSDGSGSALEGASLTGDYDGNIFLSCRLYTTSVVSETFDSITFNDLGDDQIYILEYNSIGHVIWGLTLPGGGDDWNTIKFDNECNLLLGGDYMVNPFILGNDTLIPSSEEDPFVAKLHFPLCTPHPTNTNVDVICDQSFFNIYPNPSSSDFSVTTSGCKIEEIKVFNILGQVVKEQTSIDNILYKLDMIGIAKGIYFAQITDETNSKINKKIIIQ